MKIAKITIVIFIAIVSISQISASNPIEIRAANPTNQAMSIAEKGEAISINITLDPNGNQISGIQYSFPFNASKIYVRNNTMGDMFLTDDNGGIIRNVSNNGSINGANGRLSDVWWIFVSPGAQTSRKGNVSTITIVGLENGTVPINLSDVIVADKDGQLLAVNVSLGSVCFSPRSDSNCNGQKGDVQDLTQIRRFLGKSASFCPRCDVNRDGNITMADYSQAVMERGPVSRP